MAKEEKKEKLEVITAVYKVNLHCPKCAHDIRKPLLRTPGVHSADVKFEKNEVTVKGAIDAKKIHQRLEKWSRKKVEIISQAKVKEAEKVEKATKKETIRTTTVKAYIHCGQCERDLRKRLLEHKGIHNVKIDTKAQTVLVEGVIEPDKLVAYMRKRAHKHAEVISPKEKKEEKKETVMVEVKSKEEVIEFKEVKKVEVKSKEGEAPYFVHYVYAPQLFSDENPNACSIM